MPVQHISFNKELPHGRMVARALNLIEEGIDLLDDVNGVLVQMRDGDGTTATDYAYATPKFGTSTDADTKALHDEIKGVLDKLNSNASVDQVKSSIVKLFARLR